MTPRTKPWTPTPGSFPTDHATCPYCLQTNIRVLPAQQVLYPHKVHGDVATGHGPICSGSGKATR
jgi:hypothetical protein